MRRIFTLCAILFIVISLHAQHVDLKQVVPIPFPGTSGHSNTNGECDSLNIFSANNWSAYYYKYRGGGSVLGTNNLTATKDATVLENANYFDVSASTYNYVTGGLVYFAFANTDVPANLNKEIVFKIYDNDGDLPGSLLGSAVLTLGQVYQDVLQGKLTEFKFESALKLPLSKKFYISVDHSNFNWSFAKKDSVAIVATDDHATANNAFQYINVNSSAQWFPVNQFWRNSSDSLNITLFIFPYVSNSIDGCAVLPVSIFNFGGTIKNNQANLNWSTAAESNNKGFYVERSNNGKDFSSIGFVKGAGNSSIITNYTYTDALIKELNVSTTYYRLKQVDLDGKFSYSQVLALNLQNIVRSKLYPNPVKDVATIELNLDAASKVTAQLISRDGKVLLNIDKGVLSAGTQQFSINTQGLAKGTYLIRIKAGDKIYSLNMVKE